MRTSGPVWLFLLLLGVSACQSDQEIIANLSEAEANEVLVVLNTQKIMAAKVGSQSKIGNAPPTYAVFVGRMQAAEALRILVDNRLPKIKSPGLGEVYPANSSSLIPSKTEEKAKFLRAIQGEVENLLKVLPGIIEARVIIVMPDQDVIRDYNTTAPTATASVAIVYNPIDKDETSSVTADEIKHLVASSVENLSPDQVSVVMSKNLSASIASTLVGLTPKPVSPEPIHQTLKIHPPAAVHSKNGNLNLWFFGVLAVSGLLLGVFGIIRNRSLRRQLAHALSNKS